VVRLLTKTGQAQRKSYLHRRNTYMLLNELADVSYHIVLN